MNKTFLDICNAVWLEAGLSGHGLDSVHDLTGIERRVVGWVRQGWVDIQEYRIWPWMFSPHSFYTSADKAVYSPVEMSLVDFRRWELKKGSSHRNGSFIGKVEELSWRDYESKTVFANQDLRSDTPATLSVNPEDGALHCLPVPDGEYQIRLHYYRMPQILKENSDTLTSPSGDLFEEAVKWRALWYYAVHDGSPPLMDQAATMYDQLLHDADNRIGDPIIITPEPIA